MDVDGAGAAKRRRERRLRAMLRHERMTVAAELAAALRRSRDGVRETHRRRQAEGQALVSRRSQRRSERRSRVGTWLPGALLVVPALQVDDGVDGTTVFSCLKLKEEEKERRRKLKALDRRKKAGERLSSPDGDAWREWKSVSLGLSSRKRKRKKRKKWKRVQEYWLSWVVTSGFVPVLHALLASTVNACTCFGSRGFGRFPHIPFARGNLDIVLQNPDIWHPPVRCLSRPRSTGILMVSGR